LGCELAAPERVRLNRLRDAGFSQQGVSPDDGFVAVQQGVVTVPGGGTVVRLGRVVESLAVPGQEQDLVGYGRRGRGVECVDVVGEALPLGWGGAAARGEGGVAEIALVYEAEVRCCLGRHVRCEEVKVGSEVYIVEPGR
jgi:hypothetical protein